MSTEKRRIVLRNGKKDKLQSELLVLGEPAYLTDTGELVFKKDDGTLTTLKQLESEDVTLEHLSEEVKQKFSSLEKNLETLKGSGIQNNIYVGEEEPTDENITMWTDTSEEVSVINDQDKTEIANKVLEMLPVWDGGSY